MDCVPSSVGSVRRHAGLHEWWIDAAWSDIFQNLSPGAFKSGVCVIVGGTDDNMLWKELTKLHGAVSFLRS